MSSPFVIKRDAIFYPAVLLTWVLILFAVYGTYKYTSTPLPSLAVGNQLMQQREILSTTIVELKNALQKEKDPSAHEHILHNLGISYYDLYRSRGERPILDSARGYFEASLERQPDIARFYYNLGRVYTELRDQNRAEALYKQTLAINPAHLLALHNLALLNYFERQNAREAKNYFERVIAINPRMPLTNYMLGEIAQDDNQFSPAIRYYELETAIDSTIGYSASALPVSFENIRYARTMAHQRLALLYSTRIIDQKKAQNNLHRYLYLERDTVNRNRTLAEIKKLWIIQ